VARRFFLVGTCWPTFTDQWSGRIESTREQIESVIAAMRATMRDAGYDPGDYELVLQSYPGPVSPDVEDNPRFPGWYDGGCVVYLADAAFARNKAVPMFERAVCAAATNTGTRYLDASRLFHGHEVCTEDPMVRGLFIEFGVWNENAARQSMHPNARGHAAFAECMTQFFNTGQNRATCVDPASTGHATVYPGLMEFKQLRNLGTGGCVDGDGYNSRLNTTQVSHSCNGGRNQGFWYDGSYRSLHSELNHDRCLDISGGAVAAASVKVHNCDGGANQKWSIAGNRIHPASNTGLCLGFTYPFLGIGDPTLRVSACDSGDVRQRWAFEPRTATNPVGYGRSDFIGSAVY
jgi:hypothetical protein